MTEEGHNDIGEVMLTARGHHATGNRVGGGSEQLSVRLRLRCVKFPVLKIARDSVLV